MGKTNCGKLSLNETNGGLIGLFLSKAFRVYALKAYLRIGKITYNIILAFFEKSQLYYGTTLPARCARRADS